MLFRHRIIPTFTVILLIGCLSACGSGDENVTLRLTPAERSRIDTIYRTRLDSLRPIWDLACDTSRPRRLAAAVDSIVSERIEEEERLRARTKLPPIPQ